MALKNCKKKLASQIIIVRLPYLTSKLGQII